MYFLLFTLIGLVLARNATNNGSTVLDYFAPNSFAVLGENATFRAFPSNQTFNPHNITPPFIQVFDPSFSAVLGSNPTFRQIASSPSFVFAYEAMTYAPQIDEIFFASSLPDANLTQSNRISKMSMKDVENALQSGTSSINVPFEVLDLSGSLNMTSGGTGPFHGSLVLVTEGFGENPPVIALLNPNPPYNTTVVLDNYFGRQFNSFDDVKIHPSGNIFFTDTIYGSFIGVRSALTMSSQVYMFDPETGNVQVVVGDIQVPNGLAFSPDGKTAYVTDTSEMSFGGEHPNLPALINAFDVDPDSLMFMNKRAFAFPDAGVPDGITVDINGNVYAGCGDGVQVWNAKGRLLGKFFTGSGIASVAFAGDGRLMMCAGNAMYIAKIDAKSGIYTS